MTETSNKFRIIITDFQNEESRESGLACLAEMLAGSSKEQLSDLFAREGNLQIRDIPESLVNGLGKRLEDRGVVFRVESVEPVESVPTVETVPADSTAETVSTVGTAGTVVLKPMGLVDIIYRTIKLYTNNIRPFYGITFAFTLLASTVMYGTIFGSINIVLRGAPSLDFSELIQFAATSLGIIGIATFLYIMSFLYMVGCLVATTDMKVRGIPWEFAEVRSRLKGRFLPMVWTVLLMAAIVSVLLATGIVAATILGGLLKGALGDYSGIFMGVLAVIVILYPSLLLLRYLLAPVVVVLEGKKGTAALSRSSSLMRVKSSRGLWSWNVNRAGFIMLLAFIANLSVTLLVLFIHLAAYGGAMVMHGDPLEFFSVLPLHIELPLQIIGVALHSAVTPLWVIALTLLYYDARVRSEGLEMEAPGLMD